jgi:hypothetical protein
MTADQNGVRRYRRKPTPPREEDVIAARYEPGQPLGALAEVAREYDPDAELAEAVFPSGPVLVVGYYNMEGERCFREWKVIEPGGYLACGGFLFDTSEAGLRQWYDLADGTAGETT